MRLLNLSLTQFRNFARLDVDLPMGTVLLIGGNAQGKTSILEAIYFLATFNSFHADRDRQLINFLEARNPLAVARISAAYQRGEDVHNLEVRIIQEHTKNGVARTRKELLLDGVKKKASELIGHFNAVLFLPQMLQIIEDSPSYRRRYLDLTLAQVSSSYAANLTDYLQVLSQRNALLKQLNEGGGDRDQLAFWDERLATRGAHIIHSRVQALEELDKLAGGVHRGLTRGEEILRLDYRPAYDPLPTPPQQMDLLVEPAKRSHIPPKDIQAGFLQHLKNSRREEIARGVTTSGPHRDEFRFLSNGMDLGIYGSRGQVRTALLTLKLTEIAWMREKTGHWPVLLFDEVLAELDTERREALLAQVDESQQSLLTTTDLDLFTPEFADKSTLWTIAGGRLKED